MTIWTKKANKPDGGKSHFEPFRVCMSPYERSLTKIASRAASLDVMSQVAQWGHLVPYSRTSFLQVSVEEDRSWESVKIMWLVFATRRWHLHGYAWSQGKAVMMGISCEASAMSLDCRATVRATNYVYDSCARLSTPLSISLSEK
jgi:hypothetical protein